MQGEISTLGWVIIIILVVFIVTLNFSLVSALKKKNPRKNQMMEGFKNFNQSLKDPWKNEDAKLNELSQLTDQLKNSMETKKKSN